MFTIGEFSKVTGLTVKTLRFYHEQGLLAPAFVDPQTGYRHYDAAQVEAARTIAYLRALDFPVAMVKEILSTGEDEDVLGAVRRHKAEIDRKVRHLRGVARSLEQFIADERQATIMATGPYAVQEKVLDGLLVAGIRMTGRYDDCGKAFARLGRGFGRHVCGKPFLLHYDEDYKEDDADFEACFPVRRAAAAVEGVSVRELPGGRCVSLLHKGPYDQLGHAYAAAFQYVRERQFRVVMPTREVYLKGPGMIFKGNPRNYLTEIQIPIDGTAGGPPAPGGASSEPASPV